jgi:hypothetical protein
MRDKCRDKLTFTNNTYKTFCIHAKRRAYCTMLIADYDPSFDKVIVKYLEALTMAKRH